MDSQPTVLRALSGALLADWTVTLSLIFGGCCSNALTLEQLTTEYPRSGSLITFCQFFVITLQGGARFIVWRPYPHLKPRQIPLWRYLVQVILFYGLSSLNNAAFAYNIPMTVHIIFRSAGLVISMCMGYLFMGKRYNMTQIASVLLVTIGVILTTLSAAKPKPAVPNVAAATFDLRRYLTGIYLLTVALVLGGLLGVAQEQTYAAWATSQRVLHNGSTGGERAYAKEGRQDRSSEQQAKPWQESMFYIHFLSMPMFLTVWHDLVSQMRTLTKGPDKTFAMPLPTLHASEPSRPVFFLRVPVAHLFLCLNTLTQLLCVSGVNRLTARVSNLTVTLVLVVRKAVSLLLSVWLSRLQDRNQVTDTHARTLLWAGAACVFLGTIAYSAGGRRKQKQKQE